ncbi:MAG TPA: glycosyltransferase 87 family protein [Thermoleophilaceae bacterium]|nr:glycosyltransferase 87 family protein [Thermoleophilaceae bacterium]
MRAAAGAAALLAAGFALTFLVGPWDDESISDLPLYSSYAQIFLDGHLPYRDVAFEYPPLAWPVLTVAGLAGDQDAYRIAFAVLAVALAVAMVALCGRLATATGGDRTAALLGAAAAPVLCGAMLRTHFDLVPVVLTLAALALLCAARPRAGMAVLGVAVVVKLDPLVVAPVALAWLVARDERRAAVEGAAALALVVVVAYGAVATLSPAGVADSFTYHLDRPVQVESTPAIVVRALDSLGLGAATPNDGFRSDGLDHPAGDLVAALFTALLAAAVAVLATGVARAPDERALVLASLAATVAFACLGKVLSPQFLIWVMPLLALALAWRMRALAALSALAVVLTLFEFPGLYREVVDRDAGALALVVVRDLALLGVVGVAMWSLGERARGSGGSPWPSRPRRPRSAPR